VYLAFGLAVILGFIGVKLILGFLHEWVSPAVPNVTIAVSLAVISAVLAATTIASLLRSRTHPGQRAHAGRLGSPARSRESQPRSG
jgi:tellurite resistance protein TerC